MSEHSLSGSDQLGDFRTSKRMLLICALAVPIGVASTYVARGLIWLIALFTNISFFQRFTAQPVTPQGHHLGWVVIVVPVVGALIIGLMARYGSEKIRGHGIPEALEAILLGRSRIQPKVAILKPISSAISIGTGGPFGAEGPIIMTGGAFGSIFAQLFHLSAAERKTLLVAGAAARNVGGLCHAGGGGVAGGGTAAVRMEAAQFHSGGGRGDCRVGGARAVARRGSDLSGRRRMGRWREGIVIAAGSGRSGGLRLRLADDSGLLPAKICFRNCRSTGCGGRPLARSSLAWAVSSNRACSASDTTRSTGCCAARSIGHSRCWFADGGKALVWSIALGSGTSGGVLAPLLIMGGALGALAGTWIPVGDAGLWAMIGMAAMMGGTMRSPLTAMIFAVELTHDFTCVPALLAGCGRGAGGDGAADAALHPDGESWRGAAITSRANTRSIRLK